MSIASEGASDGVLKRVVKTFWGRGLDTLEIAETIRIPESTVQKLITHARDDKLGKTTIFVPGGEQACPRHDS